MHVRTYRGSVKCFLTGYCCCGGYVSVAGCSLCVLLKDLLVFKGWCMQEEAINKTTLHPKHCLGLISSYLDLTHTRPVYTCVHTPKSYPVTVHPISLAWFTPAMCVHARGTLICSRGRTQCSARHAPFCPSHVSHVCSIITHPVTFPLTCRIYMKTWTTAHLSHSQHV